MGNLVATIKRFISNKNTVTILAVLAGVIVLWYSYNQRVEAAITTTRIPYAIEAIDSGSKIEKDNLGQKEITQSTLKDNDIIQNETQIIDKYVCLGTSIPANGFFYASQICDRLPNSVLDDIPDGYAIYSLSVTNQTTYANSIQPGDYIDLYMSAVDDDKQIIYGKLIESIEVLAVRDSSGRDLFWDSSAGDSAFLLFAVKEDMHYMLNIASLISNYQIKITPVPRNASYTQHPGETNVSSTTLQNFIMRNAAAITE